VTLKPVKPKDLLVQNDETILTIIDAILNGTPFELK
jgi:hypothetical protein